MHSYVTIYVFRVTCFGGCAHYIFWVTCFGGCALYVLCSEQG
jgi:hypothetical protein